MRDTLDLDALASPPPAAARELIVDSFAGGGGASTGIEMALGRSPDIAINHDADALALHEANHPGTRHINSSVYALDIRDVVGPDRIGLLWASPDCKHFSKAKGGVPVKKNIRDLAWVIVAWVERLAEAQRPRVIILENVEEFATWGPLTDEMRPCPERRGATFRSWVQRLRRAGYSVQWRELRACDYGAPTIRKRLFVIARRDGRPIAWPDPSHGAPDSAGVRTGLLQPWRTAAEIIDWSLPVHSIFLSRAEGRAAGVNRPLSDNTLRRIARGVARYVLDDPRPFIVQFTHANGGNGPEPIDQPLRTITCAKGGERMLAVPTLIQTGYGERPGQAPRVLSLEKPLGTAVAGGVKHALVAAFLAQHNTGMVGHRAAKPLSTICGRGTNQAVVAAHLLNLKGSDRRDAAATAPAPTICAGGGHAGLVAAFLTKYYGQGIGAALDEPCHTVTTKDRMGLVTVQIESTRYAIADIGMRMLTPRELFRAQGFPEGYRIAAALDGRAFTKSAQTRMCGNSVCPPLAAALVWANCAELALGAEASSVYGLCE